MSTRRASSPEWEHLLASVQEQHPDVTAGAMFGMPCVKLSGKAFMGSFDGGVVFKLDEPARGEALGLAGSELFDPSGKRPMREWIVVTVDHQGRWPQLAEAAVAKARPSSNANARAAAGSGRSTTCTLPVGMSPSPARVGPRAIIPFEYRSM